jgi:hypothetical protein
MEPGQNAGNRTLGHALIAACALAGAALGALPGPASAHDGQLTLAELTRTGDLACERSFRRLAGASYAGYGDAWRMDEPLPGRQ